MTETINIQTHRLIIRQLKLSDLSDFHTYRSNPEVTKYQGFDVMTIEQAETFIKNNLKKKLWESRRMGSIWNRKN